MSHWTATGRRRQALRGQRTILTDEIARVERAAAAAHEAEPGGVRGMLDAVGARLGALTAG